MIVQKVLNNSLVLSMDDDSREVIVMGKGIGFNSRPGDEIAPEKIEKLFVTQALGARSGYLEALSAIPDEVIEMAAMIISRANMQLASKEYRLSSGKRPERGRRRGANHAVGEDAEGYF